MLLVNFQEFLRCRIRPVLGIPLIAFVSLVAFGPLVAAAEKAAENAKDEVIPLSAYNVKADRIEDFGLRVREPGASFSAQAPYIEAVLPNTAASKAGLQPGDRILKSDGRSTAMSVFSDDKWRKFQTSDPGCVAAFVALTVTTLAACVALMVTHPT